MPFVADIHYCNSNRVLKVKKIHFRWEVTNSSNVGFEIIWNSSMINSKQDCDIFVHLALRLLHIFYIFLYSVYSLLQNSRVYFSFKFLLVVPYRLDTKKEHFKIFLMSKDGTQHKSFFLLLILNSKMLIHKLIFIRYFPASW